MGHTWAYAPAFGASLEVEELWLSLIVELKSAGMLSERRGTQVTAFLTLALSM
jgi:hypothetical protein